MKANGELKLEHGIEIPTHAREITSKVRLLMVKMKVGDSYLYPRARRTSLAQVAKLAKIRIATRSVDDNHVRVWRIK